MDEFWKKLVVPKKIILSKWEERNLKLCTISFIFYRTVWN